MTPITVGQHKFLPNVYAVDPATVTGLAWVEPSPLAGSPICSVTLTIGTTDWAEKAFAMFNTIDAWAANDETIIAYEYTIHGRMANNIQQMGMLRGAIECAARRRNLKTLPLRNLDVKAYATGSSRADKVQMMKALTTQCGIVAPNPDEADAIWVLAYASHLLLGGKIHDLKPRKIKPKRRKANVPTLFR